MATIYKRLSTKIQQETGFVEILLTLRNGKDYTVRGKSGIFITPANFKDGDVVVNRRKLNNDVKYHEQKKKELDLLLAHIYGLVNQTPKENISTDWLNDIIYHFWHKSDDETAQSFSNFLAEYLRSKKFSTPYINGVRVMDRDIMRFEQYKRVTGGKQYKFSPAKVTRSDIEQFSLFLKNEHSTNSKAARRGQNTIIGILKKLKSVFLWLNKTGRINNNPFQNYTIGAPHYGSPYYITIAERNLIANYPFKSKHLQTQRDIFVFQCLVGCRVSDLMRLTVDNIVDDMLVYAPHKTKDEGEQTLLARVPLHDMAKRIIERYIGHTENNKLLPCISSQKYNLAIKEIFTTVGLTRKVTVRNPLSGEPEQRPLNEIASSHLARRTFVGNAYALVKDPNLIGKMSGHVEGSIAFARYRKIEDDALKDIISKM
jgi:integrase